MKTNNEKSNRAAYIAKKPNPMSKVNLDALIPKADFIFNESAHGKPATIELNILRLSPQSDNNKHSIVHLLKKPDFQRETNEWDKKRIAELIEAFYNGAFIPAIILWRNEETGYIYVIDGAHRLSAIMAYINDDYGDSAISHKFYGYNTIPQAQIQLAQETREYINSTIGSYKDVMEGKTKDLQKKADGLNLGSFAHQIINGDLGRAEDSFFKINQQGVVLSPTEKKLCKGRKLPSCLATRIIMKGLGASQYWVNFTEENQRYAKEIGTEIHNLLFLPPYKEESASIILHHPLAGGITSALPMVYELIKIIKTKNEKEDVLSGGLTVEYLNSVRKMIRLILSDVSGSLQLFPSVYFYNSSGSYIQSSLLGMTALLIEKENDKDFLIRFTMARKGMEAFLVDYKVFLTQMNKHYGSRERSYRHFKGFFSKLIDYFQSNTDVGVLLGQLKSQYDFLNESESDFEKPKSGKFGVDQKKYLNIKEDILHLPKCKICDGFLYTLYRSPDHISKQEGGGKGKSDNDNHQSTHRYCNHSREKLEKIGFYKPVKII